MHSPRLLPRLASIVALITAGVCLYQADGLAEPVGSPSGILRKGQWLLGLGSGGVFGRTVKATAGGTSTDESVYNIEHVRGYGLTDWLSLYGKIGWAYMAVSDAGVQNSFGSNLLLGGQVKARIWHHPRWNCEWDGSLQYLWIGAPHQRGRNQGLWQEYQLATSVAKSFGRFTPYIGAKASLANFSYKLRKNGKITTIGQYKPRSTVGPFVGADYVVGEDLIVNIESAYINGSELTVTVSRRL